VLTHPQILEAVWGPANVDKTHYLHVYMTHLREKIEPNPEKPQLLLTELRVGYRLNAKLPAQGGSGLAQGTAETAKPPKTPRADIASSTSQKVETSKDSEP
jgi:DNA-binding winged helix-turn-helix (wHTH) protein